MDRELRLLSPLQQKSSRAPFLDKCCPELGSESANQSTSVFSLKGIRESEDRSSEVGQSILLREGFAGLQGSRGPGCVHVGLGAAACPGDESSSIPDSGHPGQPVTVLSFEK